MSMEITEREKDIYKVTWLGSAVNLILFLFKLIAGIIGYSSAMVADAIHSLSDFVTDIIVIIFVRISSKPADKIYEYGHGKYETFATLIISLLLLLAGIGIAANGILEIVDWAKGNELEEPRMIALAAALISIALKEWMFRYTIKVGRLHKSPAVIANAWHHRSDAWSSVGTAIGIGGAILLGTRWRVLDPLAAVIVSGFIIHAAIGIMKPTIGELLEKALPDTIQSQIKEIVLKDPGVYSLHNLRTRRIGNRYAIEFHIRMEGSQTLIEAHNHTIAIEKELKKVFGENTHVAIHMEPLKSEYQ